MVSCSTVDESTSHARRQKVHASAELPPGQRWTESDVPGTRPTAYFGFYGVLNRIAAWVLLIPALPLMLVTSILVKLTSPGPVIYRQTRVGRGGRNFMVYKIRTMVADAEAKTGAVWTTSQRDYRITPLGKLLRKTHLDELPQLWNVIRGDMALVGPRPERPEFTKILADAIPGYLDRLNVLPGITGLAQINLPPDDSIASVRRKVVLDLDYIRRGSLPLDLRIICCTVFRLVGLPSTTARRLLRVYRSQEGLAEELDTMTDATIPDLKAWSGSATADQGRRSAK